MPRRRGRCSVEELLKRKPAQLSGGQRQRVAIGRAIVRDPEVFLFDEPLSNLDAELRVSMRVEIAKLHQHIGATMIYVTHDQTEAMTLADQIVVMRAGKIEQVGTPQQLYENPDNLFVAGFIGSPRMNFLKAGCGRRNGAPGGGRLPADAGSSPTRPTCWSASGRSISSSRSRPTYASASTSMWSRTSAARATSTAPPTSGESLIVEAREALRIEAGRGHPHRRAEPSRALLFRPSGARLRTAA